jgi:U3 small nucleolar RNA-associated protein 21
MRYSWTNAFFIRNNRTLFTHVPTRRITEAEIAEVVAPVASGEGGRDLIDAAFDEDASRENSDVGAVLSSMEQLSKDIMTLSLVPKSRWQTLLHLDLIKVRPSRPTKGGSCINPSTSATEQTKRTT